MKPQDKLFLITRQDLSPGYQAVQSCHALRQFTAEHPEKDLEWFTTSNYLALLSVKNEHELRKLFIDAKESGLKCSGFEEPDVDNELTAIAIEPGERSRELCKKLPLALKVKL